MLGEVLLYTVVAMYGVYVVAFACAVMYACIDEEWCEAATWVKRVWDKRPWKGDYREIRGEHGGERGEPRGFGDGSRGRYSELRRMTVEHAEPREDFSSNGSSLKLCKIEEGEDKQLQTPLLDELRHVQPASSKEKIFNSRYECAKRELTDPPISPPQSQMWGEYADAGSPVEF